MDKLKIIYVGDDALGATSLHRARALERLGHEVTFFNPKRAVEWNRYNRFFHFHTGYVFLARAIRRLLDSSLAPNARFDVAWVDLGDYVAPSVISTLKERCKRSVNFNLDDPTGKRDWGRWTSLRRALRHYDLCVVVRKESEVEYPIYGAKKILRVWRSADEVAHRPREILEGIRERWASEVAFVGTWMPERGPFMAHLLKHGVPLTIWGDRWQKAPEWSVLRAAWRGPSLAGDDYCYAIQCAKVSLGLLSRENRDLHTTRTAEIPFAGGLFCAQRTVEHEELFTDGEGAFFWRDADECAKVLKRILPDAALRARVAEAGRRRVIERGLLNETVMLHVLGALNDRS